MQKILPTREIYCNHKVEFKSRRYVVNKAKLLLFKILIHMQLPLQNLYTEKLISIIKQPQLNDETNKK